LRIIQKEEATEDEALFFQKLMNPTLQDLKMLCHFLKDKHSGLNHQVVNSLRILKTGPHDPLKL